MVMTVLVLIFAEVMPKSYAIANPESLAPRVARPMRVDAGRSPIVLVVRGIVRALLRLFGLESDPSKNMFSVHEEIRRRPDHRPRNRHGKEDRVLGCWGR